MSKKDVKSVQAENYAQLENKCIRIARNLDDVGEYKKEQVPDYLALLDHSITIEKEAYDKALKVAEAQINLNVRKLKEKNQALIIVFQGRDSAGKSGATERIMEAVDYDMALFSAVHIGPPNEEELAHPFLWRFSRYDRMPEFGQVRVFDRSWNERLLVEPVLGITKGAELEKSYGQIRDYERLHSSTGYIIVKFWLDISKKEQLRRFKKREEKKPWKLTPSDATARKAWDKYTVYANEMFHRTASDFAPWYLISSEDKRYSRVTVLQVINQVLKENLG